MIVARIPDDVLSMRIEDVSITRFYLPLPVDPPTIRGRILRMQWCTITMGRRIENRLWEGRGKLGQFVWATEIHS